VPASRPGSDPDRGSEADGLSADSNLVAFSSTSTNLVPDGTNGDPGADPFDPAGKDVFIFDILAGTVTRVSVSAAEAKGNGYSYGGTISADGSFVAFVSAATNLVLGDLNGKRDVFVRGPL
jgi:hypothetical protein